ncbi:hypothetical protein Tco_1051298 [Tanacetum coccineum]
MVRDVKGNGKAIMKEVDDLEQRIKNLKAIFFKLRDTKLKQKEVIVISDDDTSSDHDTSKDSHDCMSEDSSEDLINFLSGRDPQWQFPRQTEEEDPLPLDIVYPLQEIASSSRGTNIRGEARYGLRSLGPIQEEVVVVKKPYSLVKVTNAVLGLRAPKAEVGYSGYGRKRRPMSYAEGGGALGSLGALKASTHPVIAIFLYPLRAFGSYGSNRSSGYCESGSSGSS